MRGDKSELRRIPKCLRHLPIWFLTEARGERGSMNFSQYSAVTLAPVRHRGPGDFTDLDTAIEVWQDHGHWFDGCGFRVTSPWVVLVIRGCVTATGNVSSRIRDAAKHVGGFWEVTRNGKDVQAVLAWSETLESRSSVFAGYPVYLCAEGVCGVTGRAVRGCGGNPMSTNTEAFSLVLHEMATALSVGVLDRPVNNVNRDGRRPRQMKLFDE